MVDPTLTSATSSNTLTLISVLSIASSAVTVTSSLFASLTATLRFEAAAFYDATVTAGSPIYFVVFAGAIASPAVTSTTPSSSQQFGGGFTPGFYYLGITGSSTSGTTSFTLQAGCETLSTAATPNLYVSTLSTFVLDSVGKYG